jgi:hypothetical protein
MMNIQEMQKSTVAELETIALQTENRQYSIACTQMVAAMNAHKLGDTKTMWAHIERCKTALVRASEDCRGQIARALKTHAVVAERGAAIDLGNKLVARNSSLGGSYTVANWIGGTK